MTSGPVGFEQAKAFYLHPDMIYWRQLAVKSLIFGLPMFVCSLGCMLFIKYVTRNPERHIIAWLAFVLFSIFACILLRVGFVHQHVFNHKYYTGASVRPLLTEMGSTTASSMRSNKS